MISKFVVLIGVVVYSSGWVEWRDRGTGGEVQAAKNLLAKKTHESTTLLLAVLALLGFLS